MGYVLFRGLGEAGERVFFERIVVVEDDDESRPLLFENAVEQKISSRIDAAIGLEAPRMNPRIPLIRGEQARSAVSRTVVHDEELPVCVGLIAYGFDRVLQAR